MKKKILSLILAVVLVLPIAITLSACKEKLKRIDDASVTVNVSSSATSRVSKIKTTTTEKREEEQVAEKLEGADSYQVANAHRYNKGSMLVIINLKLGYKILKSSVNIVEADNKSFDLSVEQVNDFSYSVVLEISRPADSYNFTINALNTTEITTTIGFGSISIDEEKLNTDIVVRKGTTEDTGIDPTSNFNTEIYEVIANPNYDDDYAYNYKMLAVYNSMGNFVRLSSIHQNTAYTSRISLNLINPEIYLGYDKIGPQIDQELEGTLVGTDIFPAHFLHTTDQLRYTEEFLNTMFSFDFKEGLTFQYAGFTDLPNGEGKAYKFVLASNSLDGFNGNGLNIAFNPTAESIK